MKDNKQIHIKQKTNTHTNQIYVNIKQVHLGGKHREKLKIKIKEMNNTKWISFFIKFS